MPIVTDGLQAYWNAKDGVASGQLKNIAPGGVVLPAALELGAVANGGDLSIYLDGTDDRIAIANHSMFTGSTAFTFEYIYTTRAIHTSGYRLLVGGSAYMDADKGVPGIYFQLMEGTSRRSFDGVTAAIDTPQKMHIVIQYDDAANLVKLFVNGVRLVNVTNEARTMKFSLAGTTPIYFNYSSGSYTYLPINFHAARFYNRFLTEAEVSTNFANGIEIGLSEPEVKIGVYRAKNAATGFTDIPIYSITNHAGEKLRLMTSAGVGYIPLVATTDPLASRVRVRVGTTTMAMRK